MLTVFACVALKACALWILSLMYGGDHPLIMLVELEPRGDVRCTLAQWSTQTLQHAACIAGNILECAQCIVYERRSA